VRRRPTTRSSRGAGGRDPARRWRRTPARRCRDADEFIARWRPRPTPPAWTGSAARAGRPTPRASCRTGPMFPTRRRAYQDVAEVDQRYYGPVEPPPEESDGDGPSLGWPCWSACSSAGAIRRRAAADGKDKVGAQRRRRAAGQRAGAEAQGLSTDITPRRARRSPRGGHRQDPGGGRGCPRNSVVTLVVPRARAPRGSGPAGPGAQRGKKKLTTSGSRPPRSGRRATRSPENHVIPRGRTSARSWTRGQRGAGDLVGQGARRGPEGDRPDPGRGALDARVARLQGQRQAAGDPPTSPRAGAHAGAAPDHEALPRADRDDHRGQEPADVAVARRRRRAGSPRRTRSRRRASR